MRISFDLDGTMTDFSAFVHSVAIKHFKRKYNMDVKYPNALEIEDVFDIENVLLCRGFSKDSAKRETRVILNKFWLSHRFIKFSLFTPFRKGVSNYIRILKKQGHTVTIDSSRDKTTVKSITGFIARTLTIMQCIINGVFLPRNHVHFYRNDKEKAVGIKRNNVDVLFDDKPKVILEVCEFTNVVCINASYNTLCLFPSSVVRIHSYLNNEPEDAVKKLLGEKNYIYSLRKAKAQKAYSPLIKYLAPVVSACFSPIVLNERHLINTIAPVIIAPNHRSTLDPVIITSVVKRPIQWAALKRFFSAEDSIFNNSKNPILRKITSYVFNKLEYFPIERKKDNPNAQNMGSIRDMVSFLSVGSSIGIFGEGTTLKDPQIRDFGDFDNSFLLLAKKKDAWVQAITVLWISDLNKKQKVMLYISEPFRVGNMSIDEAMDKFLLLQKNALSELKHAKERLKTNGTTNGFVY